MQANWDTVRFWLSYICIHYKAESIKTEVMTLADIYHGIGAARTALFCSCFVHFVYNSCFTSYDWIVSWRSVFALTLPYVVALWLFRVFERTRTAALTSLMSMLKQVFVVLPPFTEAGAVVRDEK